MALGHLILILFLLLLICSVKHLYKAKCCLIERILSVWAQTSSRASFVACQAGWGRQKCVTSNTVTADDWTTPVKQKRDKKPSRPPTGNCITSRSSFLWPRQAQEVGSLSPETSHKGVVNVKVTLRRKHNPGILILAFLLVRLCRNIITIVGTKGYLFICDSYDNVSGPPSASPGSLTHHGLVLSDSFK